MHVEILEIFKENNVNTQLGIAHMNTGHLYYYIGHINDAKIHYLDALELGKEFNALPLIGMVYRALGLLELNKNNAEKAINFLAKPIEFIKMQNIKLLLNSLQHF